MFLTLFWPKFVSVVFSQTSDSLEQFSVRVCIWNISQYHQDSASYSHLHREGQLSESETEVSLARYPAGPGPRGLSVLAATCYISDNALAHQATDRKHAYSKYTFLPLLLIEVWPLFKRKDKTMSVKIVSNFPPSIINEFENYNRYQTLQSFRFQFFCQRLFFPLTKSILLNHWWKP